jgi:hypothetical protein
MQDTTAIAWDDPADVPAGIGDGVPDRVRARFEGALIVARLDAQFGGDWCFSVIGRRTLATGETLVRGRLTALGRVSKDACGASSSGAAASCRDDDADDDAYVEAATGALVRCAGLLGVAALPSPHGGAALYTEVTR